MRSCNIISVQDDTGKSHDFSLNEKEESVGKIKLTNWTG